MSARRQDNMKKAFQAIMSDSLQIIKIIDVTFKEWRRLNIQKKYSRGVERAKSPCTWYRIWKKMFLRSQILFIKWKNLLMFQLQYCH